MTPLAPVPSNIDHSVTPTPQNSRPPLKQRKGHNPPAARKSKPPRRPPAPIDVAPINTQSQEPPQMATYPPPICPPHVDGSSQVGTAYATHHHPHLRQMCIFVNSFPPDLEETVLADALRGCLPIRIKLNPAVPNEARLLPDMHYDWMPRNGTIEFTKMDDAERALAILTNHTIFTPRGVWFSPYPPPHILPLPDSPLSTRYIRPTKLALAPSLPANPTPEQNFRAYVPTPSEVFDAVRPWGCIRSVNSYLQQTEVEGQLNDSAQGHLWMAQVEFWYEDEASRFEVGFGESCSLIKGWQVHIHGTASQPGSIPMTLPYQVPPRMLPPIQPQPFLPPTSDSMHYLPPTVGPMGDFSIQQMGVMYLGPDSLPATPLTANIPMIPNIPIGGMPHTPPPINYTPPWAAHNIFAGAGYIPEGHVDRSPLSSPVTPRSMGGRMSRASMSSLYARQRSWSLTVGESPDGELRPTGLVADDGTFIQHGPGQHIRPAPAYGPGSSSVSGLVDYSNIFVKNLDPDINSYFLEDLFSNVGQVVSARVMRDEQGRSRCYGFVSFQLPEQAAQAISAFHDTVVGRSRISVTLHEPRRLRSEKTVECHDLSLATTFGRQPAGAPRRSMSPVRAGTIDRRRSTDGNATVPGSIENLCQLSPDSRKTALTERVSTRVRSYARTNDVRDDQIGPAIQALVKLDLSLIPLFHDRPKLDSKIAEVFNKLELAKPAPTASSPASPNSQSSGAEPCSSLRPTNAELVKLREEIEKIDPDNVNEVMPVLLEMLDSADWDQLWINSGVAKKYGEAKRLLASQEDRTQVNTPNEDQQQLAKVVEIDEPPTNLIDLSGHHKNDDHAIPLEGLSIESLAFHSAKKIIDDLQGKNGLALHQELGLIAPTASEKSSLECWLTKLMMKGKVERGVEVASLLGKKIENDTLKRSQKLKVIRDLINAEGDEEALCRLTLYPALLNAKVQALLRAGQ
ncbi:hypothetical protein IAT40_006934 [Kwoniella sp. CBS 6097]